MEAQSDDVVHLYVFGLKSILDHPVSGKAHLDMTWSHFLNKVCNLRVTPEDKVIICTSTYVHNKRGWSANLNEKIRPFIEKFEIRKDKYSVRIAMQMQNETEGAAGGSDGDLSPSQSTSNGARKRTSGDRNEGQSATTYRSYDPLRPAKHARTVSSYSIGNRGRNVVQEEVEDSIPLPAADDGEEGEFEEDEIPFQRADRASANSRNSFARGTPNISNERRRSQPQDPRTDLKPIVKERFQRFNNPFLLRVSDEVQKLQQRGLWDRNVQHAPLASYLLQELLFD